jgi:hypothetical protein
MDLRFWPASIETNEVPRFRDIMLAVLGVRLKFLFASMMTTIMLHPI